MEFYKNNPEFRDHLMLEEDTGARVTYGDFAKFYQSVKEKLESHTLLFLFCENTIGSVFFYLACLNQQIVPLLLDKNMDAAMAQGLVNLYQPDYLAMPMDGCGLPRQCSGPPVIEEYGYDVFRREKCHSTLLHPDLALLLTTSGSTGSPKLVRQSRYNISVNASAIAGYLELDSTERPITTLAMNYTYGLSILNSHLLAGAAVLLTRSTLFEKEFWDFFLRGGATSISGVPYTYEILKRLSFFQMDLPSLRTMTQAGGKLPPRLHREFAEYAAETGRKFIVMYGQTEATARMGYLPAEYALTKCGSMGIAIPGGTFRLMEDGRREIHSADTVGELVYEGPNVAMGYAQKPDDLAKGDERQGVLFTGDMARRDADGFYYITGRKKRFLKLYGKRVNMDEIEQMLRQEYEGIDVACAGEDDRMRIFIAGENAEFCQKAGDWLAEKSGLHPKGFQVLPIEKIPKNEAGKTLYQELKVLCLQEGM